MSEEIAAAVRTMRVQNLGFEMATTKKVIAAIPEEKREYRPDAKSRTAFELAWHIVSSEVQMLEEIAARRFSFEPRYPEVPATVAEVVAWYEQHLPAALEGIKAMSGEELAAALEAYGAFNFPAFVYLGWVENHSVHHRGQLAAYLRPMGSAVPSIYGGSADEPWAPPT